MPARCGGAWPTTSPAWPRDRLSPTRRAEDPVTGFAELNNPEDDWIYGSLDATQPERFRSLMDSLDDDPDEDEALYFLHMLLPHVPYQYLPSGVVYPPPVPEISVIPQEDARRSEAAPVETGPAAPSPPAGLRRLADR